MNAIMTHRRNSLPKAWEDALRRRDFCRGEGGYHLNGLVFKHNDRWLTFETDQLPKAEAVPSSPSWQLGFWSRVHHGAIGTSSPTSPDGTPHSSGGAIGIDQSRDFMRWVFELPSAVVGRQERDELTDLHEDTSLDAYLNWVLASAHNTLPKGWSAPPRNQVESWLPAGALTIQHGTFLRQGELILHPNRWTLCFPIAPALPPDLPADREAVLIRVISQAQDQWRMVRLQIQPAAENGGSVLHGVVDLSGAPHSPALFLASLDALRHVVLWLVETVDLLADVTVTIRSLAICCSKTNQIERSEV